MDTALGHPLVVEICAKECPFPPDDWSGTYDQQREQWDGMVCGSKNTNRFTTCGTTGGKTQDYDDDDTNQVTDT